MLSSNCWLSICLLWWQTLSAIPINRWNAEDFNANCDLSLAEATLFDLITQSAASFVHYISAEKGLSFSFLCSVENRFIGLFVFFFFGTFFVCVIVCFGDLLDHSAIELGSWKNDQGWLSKIKILYSGEISPIGENVWPIASFCWKWKWKCPFYFCCECCHVHHVVDISYKIRINNCYHYKRRF